MYPFLSERSRNIKELGLNNYDASTEAASSVLSKQQIITSIPRRFSSTPIKEIWFLQFRLNSRFGKNLFQTLQHKRFRAAYDFLLIREAAGEKTRDSGNWWTNYQAASEEERLTMQTPLGKRTSPGGLENQLEKGNEK